jgi:hypothetical protein
MCQFTSIRVSERCKTSAASNRGVTTHWLFLWGDNTLFLRRDNTATSYRSTTYWLFSCGDNTACSYRATIHDFLWGDNTLTILIGRQNRFLMGRQHTDFLWVTTHYIYGATIHTAIVGRQHTDYFMGWQHTHILGTDNALHIFMRRQHTVRTGRHHTDFLWGENTLIILIKRQHILLLWGDIALEYYRMTTLTISTQHRLFLRGDNKVTSYGATVRWLFL